MIEEEKETQESLIKKLNLLDRAFLNSILSYGVYTDRQWTLGEYDANGEETEQIKSFLKASGLEDPKNINLKKSYEVFLTLFNRETFEKVPLNIPNSGSSNYDNHKKPFNFKFESGHYEALDDLAKAGIFRSKNEDGSYTLHLSFRGTDTKARKFLDYAVYAYSDMARYYEVFKPLEKAVLEYAKDPKNNISSLQVSGHSLGGAMVQAFFNSPEVKNSGLEMEGFTYGAPGAKKNIFYQLLPDVIKNSNFFGIIPLAVKAYNLAKEEMENKIDSRITQFTHSGDAIPKLGSVLYNTDGSSYALEDKANKNLHKSAILGQKSLAETVHIDHRKGRFTAFTAIAKSQEESLFSKIKNYFPNMFSKYHDMLRYSLNLEHESFSKGVELRDFKKSEDFTQHTPYMNRFKEFRNTLTRKIHVYNQDDPIMQHFLDRRKAQMTQDGRMIYRVKPDFAEMLSEMRNRAFANDIAKIAVSGLTQRKPT